MTGLHYEPAATSGKEAINFPGPLEGPLVWSGAALTDDAYTLKLRQDEVREVESALQTFKELGLDGDEVSRYNFPLPTLGQRLEIYALSIHEGRGLFVLKGLDASCYDVEDSVIIYLGIASYIGNERGQQDRKGNMLSHITNSKLWKTPVEQRHGIHSSKALPFHTDMGCDILALQVRRSAHKGGCTFLSSAWRVFNELLLHEPEVLMTLLACNWPVQVSGSQHPNYYLAQAFTIHEGRLMASMDPNRFGPHPQDKFQSSIPNLNAAQKHAIERVSNVARQMEARLDLQTGDLLFFNNWALLHRRESYKDDEDTSRHMVRLWIRSTTLGWAVPKSMESPWLAAYGGLQKTRLYPLIPMPNYKVPKYSAGSAAFLLDDSDESDDGHSHS